MYKLYHTAKNCMHCACSVQHLYSKNNISTTPPKFNIAPKKILVGRLLSFWGPAYFQARTVKFSGVYVVKTIESFGNLPCEKG